MPRANLIVIRVVRRGDFYGASAKGHVYSNFIGDDRQAAINERMFSKSSMKVLREISLKFTFRRK